jgi:2-hydroxy-3-keto-5-methylthiopentenyl-1-phosphate phosphatase
MPFFPYKDKNCLTCAHCKKKTILSKSAPGELKIYIGDGQSDICPAKYADKIFAKDTLLKYCRKEKIPHTPYKNLKKVYDYLKKEY